MKRVVPLVLVLVSAIALSGCASILKSMGGVSKDEFSVLNKQVSSLASQLEETKKIADSKVSASQLDEIKASLAKLEEIKADLATLKQDLASIKATTDELAKTKAAVDALYAQVSKLADDTLLRLARIIEQAVAAQPGPAAQPADPAAPATK